MSHMDDLELARLGLVAAAIRDALEERGVRVDSAVSLDEAFDTGSAISTLERCLVQAGARAGTAVADGLDFRRVSGGLELRMDGAVTRRLRVRRATRSAAGDLVVKSNSESALTREEVPSLFPDEHWVLAWILDADHQLREAVAAEITGYAEGTPGRLIFGLQYPITPSSDSPSDPGRFERPFEDLDFPGDNEEFGEAAS